MSLGQKGVEIQSRFTAESLSEAGPGVSEKRVQPPGERRCGFRKALAPSVKEPPLALRQKIFRPPAPLVAVLAQGFVIFLEVDEKGFQLLKLGLDDAQAREKRGVRLQLEGRRCVQHDGDHGAQRLAEPESIIRRSDLPPPVNLLRCRGLRRGFDTRGPVFFGAISRLLEASATAVGKGALQYL
jgi:hypothetical protein